MAIEAIHFRQTGWRLQTFGFAIARSKKCALSVDCFERCKAIWE
jgi:hypothetical protein